MINKYVVIIPIFGSAGTRNPYSKYLGYGQLVDTIDEAYISEDKDYQERLLKLKKRENDIYKKGFVALV